MDISDRKIFPSERTGYTLPPGVYGINDINKTLAYFLPDFVKVSISIDDIRLRSNLKTNQTLIFTKKSFFYTFLGFVKSQSGILCDFEGSVQLILGTYKSDKHVNNTEIDKLHLKCNCINGSIVNGIRE